VSRPRHVVLVLMVCALAALLPCRAAGASTSLSEPHGNPYVVPLDAAHNPLPFTIVAKGFPEGTRVYVEQCDGLPDTDAKWDPTVDCDPGTSPAAVVVGADGVARFPADDSQHAFTPVVGKSPSGDFNCLAVGAPSPQNGLHDFHTCYVRVSSDNIQRTNDQVSFPYVVRTGASSSSSSSSSTWWIVVIVLVVIGLAVAAVVVVSGRRRTRQHA